MTLQQIDDRLVLCKKYLPFLLEEKYKYDMQIDYCGVVHAPEHIYKIYKECGMLLFMVSDSANGNPITFNRWLEIQGRKDLVV